MYMAAYIWLIGLRNETDTWSWEDRGIEMELGRLREESRREEVNTIKIYYIDIWHSQKSIKVYFFWEEKGYLRLLEWKWNETIS